MYTQLKDTIKKALFDTTSKSFFITSDALAVFTVLSVLAIILETVPSLAGYASLFKLIDLITLVVFSIEYVARVWLEDEKLKYIFSFYGLVDLFSILPSYLGLGNFAFLKTARLIRLLRLLRLMRLAKVAKLNHEKEKNHSEKPVATHGANMRIYLLALTTVMTIIGSIIYAVEGGGAGFESIPASMVWALRVIVGGVPAMVPVTLFGGFVHIITRFLGIILFGLLISLMNVSVKRLLLGGGSVSEK